MSVFHAVEKKNYGWCNFYTGYVTILKLLLRRILNDWFFRWLIFSQPTTGKLSVYQNQNSGNPFESGQLVWQVNYFNN